MNLPKLYSCILLLSLVSVLHLQTVKGGSTYFVDPRVILVDDFEGWGTSLAWWADILGGMEQSVIDTVTDAFFSPDELNLNIVRYVIGGTSRPNETGDYPCGPFRPGGATESFKDNPDADYDWTRDPRQIKILQIAKKKGVDTFEAFSNSPPEWLTISGCSKGNNGNFPLHENMVAENSRPFAEYAADVIAHFHNNLNLTFSTYVPFNEASGLLGIGGWSGSGSSQEGCNMKLDVMTQIVKDVSSLFQERNMDYVQLSAADETQINQAILTQNYFRENNVTHLIEKVNVHGYWDNLNLNRRDLLHMHANKDGQRLWMDEMGWGGTSGGNMMQGLEVANRIIFDLKNLMPSAWIYWQAMEERGLWGLLELPYNNPTVENIQYNSGFYAMKQFSKYIKKGFTIIQIHNKNAVAAYNFEQAELVIVVANPENVTMAEQVFDLGLFDTLELALTAIRTSPIENTVEVNDEIFFQSKKLVYDTPPQSITTFIISNAKLNESEGLIFESHFETVEDQMSWTLNDGWEQGVSDAYAIKGKYSGYLPSGILVRSVHAPKDGNFYLSAWCSSDNPGTELSVQVAGDEVANLPITPGETFQRYQSYGVIFSARKDQEITIRFAGQSESYIDDVVLSFVSSTSDNNSANLLRIPEFNLLFVSLIMALVLAELY